MRYEQAAGPLIHGSGATESSRDAPRCRRPPAERERDRQGQEQEHEPEDDFSDSWRAYRERADHLGQTYGWTVLEPTPRAEPWLPRGALMRSSHLGGGATATSGSSAAPTT
jgi:hypothetical protein